MAAIKGVSELGGLLGIGCPGSHGGPNGMGYHGGFGGGCGGCNAQTGEECDEDALSQLAAEEAEAALF